MRRTALVLVSLVVALGLAAAGCGGEEEATPTPDTVIGTTDTTETTETDTTETETTETETETTDTGTDTGTGGQGDPAAGKTVFITNCGGCHTLADAGTSGTIGPNLDAAKPSVQLAVDRVTNGKGVMPAFKDSYSAEQIAAVADYVVQNAGQ